MQYAYTATDITGRIVHQETSVHDDPEFDLIYQIYPPEFFVPEHIDGQTILFRLRACARKTMSGGKTCPKYLIVTWAMQ